MKKEIYFTIVLLSLIWGCSDNTATGVKDTPDNQQISAPGSISEDKTKEVLEHHWKAFTQNNMEEVMADYTEESVLITPDRTYKGLAEIQENFENAYRTFPKVQTTFLLNKSVIAGEVGYILWQAKTPTLDLSYASDTFIIRDGKKIISQTFAGVATALKE